jgi:4a-hydroxytetrahydrobiopterin dehydratase
MTRLPVDLIHLRLEKLPGWELKNKGIEKEFIFSNFAEAFTFMTLVASLAESLQHHPDWSNVYNKVYMKLTTHEAGGVTERDLAMATEIEKLLPKD